jgi:serpin B
LVLMNAIYLAFQWEEKFTKPATGWTKEEFTCMDGTKALVSMMKQEEEFPIYENENFEMLEKSYLSPEGRKLSQLIFLPKEGKSLSEIENSLTEEVLKECRTKARTVSDVHLTMPKIKAELDIDLLKILKGMGLPLEMIDQSKIQGGDELFIDKVIHKTFVLNDEKGSEAAAVTAACFQGKCMKYPREFNINRAYAYFIMDDKTVIFRGRVADKAPLVVDS